jgi:hypothetical protein
VNKLPQPKLFLAFLLVFLGAIIIVPEIPTRAAGISPEQELEERIQNYGLELSKAIRAKDPERVASVLDEEPRAANVILLCPCYGCGDGQTARPRTPLVDAIEVNTPNVASLIANAGGIEAIAIKKSDVSPMNVMGWILFNRKEFLNSPSVPFPDPKHHHSYHTRSLA